MAALTDDVKRFIVERLACYDTPKQVADAVREAFAVEVDRRQVERYDAERPGKKPGEKWCATFKATRERFLEETSAIGITHKAVRLRWLHQLATRAMEKGNAPEARAAMRQAAEDVGGVYTNKRDVTVREKSLEEVLRELPGAGPDADAARAAEALAAGAAPGAGSPAEGSPAAEGEA